MAQVYNVVTRGGSTLIADDSVFAVVDNSDLAVRSGRVGPAMSSFMTSPDGEDVSKKAPVMLDLSAAFIPLLRPARSRLSRLALNVTNACNLWCSYCYADHGYYHAKRSMMSADDAMTIVGKVLQMYPSIDVVHFFGGEPLLNHEAVRASCEYFKRMGLSRTKFVATTNGTVLSASLERTLLDYDIGLTVSVDGPKEIHDANRPTTQGGSSFDLLRRNVDRLLSLGVPVEFECTYTVGHRQRGISVADLLQFFAEEFGQRVAHIAWAHLPRPKSRPGQAIFDTSTDFFERQYLDAKLVETLWREGAKVSMSHILAGNGCALSFVVGILERLAAKEPASSYCPAFTSQLSVATDGSVYPCFMFIGDPKMRLGNILTDESLSKEKAESLWALYSAGMKSLPTGTAEWYRGLMQGCVAGEYAATSTFDERVYETVYAAMAEEVLMALATSNESGLERCS
jgi:uncharacterized protein